MNSVHTGLIMECDYREGRTQDEAFDEAFDFPLVPLLWLEATSGLASRCHRDKYVGRAPSGLDWW